MTDSTEWESWKVSQKSHPLGCVGICYMEKSILGLDIGLYLGQRIQSGDT